MNIIHCYAEAFLEYIYNKLYFVGEPAFPLTDIISWVAHSTIIFMNSSCVVLNPCDSHLTFYKCEAYLF